MLGGGGTDLQAKASIEVGTTGATMPPFRVKNLDACNQ